MPDNPDNEADFEWVCILPFYWHIRTRRPPRLPFVQSRPDYPTDPASAVWGASGYKIPLADGHIINRTIREGDSAVVVNGRHEISTSKNTDAWQMYLLSSI